MSWLLYGLHLGLTISLPFVLVFLFGCKKIEEERPSYGPEVSGAAVDKALDKALTGATLDNVKVGQFLDHSVSRRLENEETTMAMGGTRVEVIDKQETASTVNFTLRIAKSQRLQGGEFETRVSEEPLVLNKTASLQRVTTAQLAARPVYAALAAKAGAEVAAAERKVVRVTYHNLQEFTERMAAPKAVAARADCGGLSACSLEVRYIRFDIVEWYEDGGTSKVALDFGFSIDPPYLPFGESFDQFTGLMVVDCRSTYVAVETRTVYVRDCMTLDDFQK